MTARTRRAGFAVIAAATAVTTVLGTTVLSTTGAQAQTSSRPATKIKIHAHVDPAGWRGKTAGLERASSTSRTAYFVQLAGRGAVEAGRAADGRSVPSLVLARRSQIAGTAGSAFGAAHAADSGAVRLYTVTNLVPGFAVNTNLAGVRALASRGDVVKVSRIIPKKPVNANTASLVRALQTWRYPGGTGKGARIGIIDTGLDYTHADFGGVGTAAAYTAAKATDTSAGWRDSLPALAKIKIEGGYDFVGDDYDANPAAATYQPVPHPDPNPLDCNEHGTHVAGTAAGYGVGHFGHTFTGAYADRTSRSLLQMQVGPGMAPEARIFPLKVFGCTGSTDAVIEALDAAMDPNHDGNTKDHLDMVNLSLGSDYGVVDDPENLVVDKLAQLGVLPVIAMGNAGDETDAGGAPGNAVGSLAVASTVDSYQLRDGLQVNAPAAVAGIASSQFSVAYNWPGNGPSGAPVTGQVVALPGSNSDGCNALSAADKAKVAGKVAWLIWDDNDSTRRCGSVARAANVAAAGAVGAIFTSGLDVFGAGITGSPTIPVVQVPKKETDRLSASVNAGTLNVTFDGKYQATVKDITPSITDTLSSFSSRGTHGSLGIVKPDVAAPGDTIASAAMGTGNKTLVISGTSMATPLIAGVSALVKGAHPSWGERQIKAAVMNTATHDVWSAPSQSGQRYAPARVGTGRVDAKAAVNAKVLAYVDGKSVPVTASFGVVPAPVGGGAVKRTKRLTVQNMGGKATTVTVSYDGVNVSPGVSYSVTPSTLTIPPGQSRKTTVTMKVMPSMLRHRIDETMAVNQTALGASVPRQFVSDSSGHLVVTPQDRKALRVSVYGAAKPVSTTTATYQAGSLALTGHGVRQGGGPTAFESQVSVMQLGATSGSQPQCSDTVLTGCWSNQSDHSGDIRYTGAGSSGDFLWFGISTRHDWATNNTMTPFVDIDTNGDGKPDLETYVQNAAATDVLLAYTVDYTTGKLLDVEAANFNFGDVDTNVFDTNVMLLPISKSALGLTKASQPLTYWGGTFNGYTGANQDYTGPASFDAGSPALSTSAPLFSDQGGTTIPVTGSGAALVFHLLGADKKRDQVVVANPAGKR